MSTVEDFYDELHALAADLTGAAFELQADVSNLTGGDPGGKF